MIEEVKGNLWDYPAPFRCVTTNGIVKKNGELVMGAGIALQAKTRFPDLPMRLGKLVTTFSNKPFFLNDIGIISFPTKNHFKDNSDLELIKESARHINAFAHIHNVSSIVMSRPGCGNGNLQWSDVKPVLESMFTSNTLFIVCHE